METADDNAVIGFIEQRQGEALIAARIREWIEADKTLFGEKVARGTFHERHPCREFVQITTDLMNGLEVLPKDRLKVPALDATG
jgi:hypothetical protein